MAKKIVHSKRPLSLGSSLGSPFLKVGKNIIDEIHLRGWYIDGLVKSGDILIENAPDEPSVENGKVIEVGIPEGSGPVLMEAIQKAVQDIENKEVMPPAKVAKPAQGRVKKLAQVNTDPVQVKVATDDSPSVKPSRFGGKGK